MPLHSLHAGAPSLMAWAASRKRSATAARYTVACLAALLWSGPARTDSDVLEYSVKAAYLCKLPEFVAWPPGVLPQDSFVLCIVGQGPFGTLLDRAAEGQTVQGRPVTLRHYGTAAESAGCHLIYVAGSDAQPIASVLASIRGTPVLTVTDGQSSPGSIGIINFVMVNGRVRFEVDQRAAAENSLVISSKLLSLAVRVRTAR